MLSARVGRPQRGALGGYYRFCVQRSERAALIATDRAATLALNSVRNVMAASRLGRLGGAIGATSDLKQSGRVHRREGDGFSASGVVYIKGSNDRTVGTIIAYTEGADIRPVSSPWLWIASPDLQKRVAGNSRMTPAQYRSKGFEQKIGPLFQIPGRHAGEALLVVRDVTTRIAGRPNPRALPKSGRVRAGRQLQNQFVAFVGIRRTSRAARTNIPEIMRYARGQLPGLYREALGKI